MVWVDVGKEMDFTKLNARIRLIPVLPSSSPVLIHHLSPAHRNLRVKPSSSQSSSSDTALPTSSKNGEPSSLTPTPAPTPIYNTDLLLHTIARERLLVTHQMMKEVPAFRDALALLRVWANQREYCPAPIPYPRSRSEDEREQDVVVAGFDRGGGQVWLGVMQSVVLGEETFGVKGGSGGRRGDGRDLSSYQLFKVALDFLGVS